MYNIYNKIWPPLCLWLEPRDSKYDICTWVHHKFMFKFKLQYWTTLAFGGIDGTGPNSVGC